METGMLQKGLRFLSSIVRRTFASLLKSLEVGLVFGLLIMAIAVLLVFFGALWIMMALSGYIVNSTQNGLPLTH